VALTPVIAKSSKAQTTVFEALTSNIEKYFKPQASK
jgi:hypothetical protein